MLRLRLIGINRVVCLREPVQTQLLAAIAAGVGLSSALGVLRVRLAFSLKPTALVAAAAALFLSVVAVAVGRGELLGLAWDLGAVATGPVTVRGEIWAGGTLA